MHKKSIVWFCACCRW